MKHISARGTFSAFLFFLLSGPVQAEDYYVSPTGSGNGSSETNAASLTDAITKVKSYSTSADPLNVIFTAGDYHFAESQGFTFKNTSAVRGMTINFRAKPGEIVTFKGTSTESLIAMTSYAAIATNPFTVNFANITIDGMNMDAKPLFNIDKAYNFLNISGVTIRNVTSGGNMFAVAVNNSGITVENCHISGNRAAKSFFYIDGNSNTKLTLLNDTLTMNEAVTSTDMESFIYQSAGDCFVSSCLFAQNSVAKSTGYKYNSLYAGSSSARNPIFINSTFSKNEIGSTAASNSRFLFYFQSTASDSTIIRDCSIIKNNVSTSTQNPDYGLHLINLYNASSNPFIMTGTTVADNILEGANSLTNNKYLLNLADAYWDYVINNTFANNTGMLQAVAIGTVVTASGGVYILNNTFCKTGGIFFASKSNDRYMHILNNILYYGGTPPQDVISGQGTDTEIARNIIGDRFYDTGITNGANMVGGKPVTYYVDFAGLSYDTPDDPDKPQKPGYFSLLHLDDYPHGIVGKGGTAAATGNSFCMSQLAFDQRGTNRRPESISVGSIDSWTRLHRGQRIVYYDSSIGITGPTDIDLTEYLDPAPWDAANGVTYSFDIVEQPDVIGTAVIANDASGQPTIASFMPHTNPDNSTQPALGTVGRPTRMIVKLTTSDGDIEATEILVIIVNISAPAGIIDEKFSSCYEPLGQTQFNVRRGYKSSDLPGQEDVRFDGFTIPLVGDLTGDGKPEVVLSGVESISTCTGGPSQDEDIRSIYILNGQTGKVIGTYILPSSFHVHSVNSNEYHGSPSWMALADPTGNGSHKSIYLAYGYTNDKYSHRVVRYDVTETAPDQLEIKEAKLSWSNNSANTNGRYNYPLTHTASIYETKGTRPVPQICDINQDGTPEILVYNKIYDAQTLELKVELETLDNSTWSSANIVDYRGNSYIGRNRDAAEHGDRDQNYSFVYDLDADGIMEVIAGGKVYYDINTVTGAYSVKSADDNRWNLNIGDGFTGVADIDGDEIADIVVVSFIDGSIDKLRISVWNPGFMEYRNGTLGRVSDRANTAPILMAQMEVPMTHRTNYGTNSYVYIGDIDGLPDSRGKRLPEISVITSRLYKGITGTVIPIHPNVHSRMSSGMAWNGKWNPATGTYSDFTYGDEQGVLVSWTWDASPSAAAPADRLKVSFMMGHEDTSFNTGFTMFDFDNDGSEEIVYRDEKNLRVISPTRPLLGCADIKSGVGDMFSIPSKSYTGYEYPVIADVNGDASADIVVISACYEGGTYTGGKGVLYMYESASGHHRFAPALSVWNQFHYSPLKINEQLVVPRKNLHPLSPEYSFTLPRGGTSFIYNNTITQSMRSAVVGGVLEAVVLLPDLSISNAVLESGATSAQIRFTVKNRGDAAASATTPICYYCGTSPGYVVPSNIKWKTTLGTVLYPDDELQVIMPITTADANFNYTISLADTSTATPPVSAFGQAFWPECNYGDNRAEVGNFVLRPDVYTFIQNSTHLLDILANDSIPITVRPSALTGNEFLWTYISATPGINTWTGDFGTFSISGTQLKYTAPNRYLPGVVALPYTIADPDLPANIRTDTIYIYVVQDARNHFFSPSSSSYTYRLKDCPAPLSPNTHGVDFIFYDSETSSVPLSIAPAAWPTIANPFNSSPLWVKPSLLSPSLRHYDRIDFPRAKLPPIKPMHTGKAYLKMEN